MIDGFRHLEGCWHCMYHLIMVHISEGIFCLTCRCLTGITVIAWLLVDY